MNITYAIEVGRPEEACNGIGWLFLRKWVVVVAAQTIMHHQQGVVAEELT
jgi:hypothetical protein